MLGSITPLGERSRGRRWGATVTAYVIGSILGGAAMGAIAGAVGVVALGWLTEPAALAILALLAALGLAADLHLGGMRLPSPRRQVDERWLHRYRGWVYGGGFGFQLGFGLLTVVTTSTVYLTAAAAGLSDSVAAAIGIGALFGRRGLRRFWPPARSGHRRGSWRSTARCGGASCSRGGSPSGRPGRCWWRPSCWRSRERSPAVKLQAHGVAATLQPGWDGAITRRQGALPVLHAASFPLPAVDGDFATAATSVMPPDGVVVTLVEYEPALAGTGLFAAEGLPEALTAADFSPATLLRRMPGQVGAQRFFSSNGRAFCLYVVLGSAAHAPKLAAAASGLIGSLELPAARG